MRKTMNLNLMISMNAGLIGNGMVDLRILAGPSLHAITATSTLRALRPSHSRDGSSALCSYSSSAHDCAADAVGRVLSERLERHCGFAGGQGSQPTWQQVTDLPVGTTATVAPSAPKPATEPTSRFLATAC